jgi:hypothetical protein
LYGKGTAKVLEGAAESLEETAGDKRAAAQLFSAPVCGPRPYENSNFVNSNQNSQLSFMRWLGIIIPLSRSTKTDFLLNLTLLLSFLQYISDFEERPINRRRAIRQIDNCSRSGWKGLLPLDSLLFSS